MTNDNGTERLQGTSCESHDRFVVGAATGSAIRRTLDGGLDIEFYKAQADQLRAEALYQWIIGLVARIANAMSPSDHWSTRAVNSSYRWAKTLLLKRLKRFCEAEHQLHSFSDN